MLIFLPINQLLSKSTYNCLSPALSSSDKMSSDVSRLSVSSIRRFPEEIREELNSLINRSSWQSLTREFSVDILTNLRVEALDNIADFVDSDYPEFQEDVRKRLGILKKKARKTQTFKGKSRVGFHSYFYRYHFCFHCMGSTVS